MPLADYKCVECDTVALFDTKVGAICFVPCPCAKKNRMFSKYRKKLHLTGLRMYTRVYGPIGLGRGTSGDTPPRGSK